MNLNLVDRNKKRRSYLIKFQINEQQQKKYTFNLYIYIFDILI